MWSRYFVYNSYLRAQADFERELEQFAEFGEDLPSELGHSQDQALHGKKLSIAVCQRCEDFSIWVEHKDKATMVYPDTRMEPLSKHVNEEIRELYCEAARIYTRSRRASTALLRLVVEKLCKHILEIPEDLPNPPKLYKMIDMISEQYKIRPEVVNAMKNTRSLGNAAAHGGLIDLDDTDDPLDIFWLVRYIVQHCVVDDIEAKQMNQSIQLKKKGT